MSEQKKPEVPSNVVEICAKGKALAAKEEKKEAPKDAGPSEVDRMRDVAEWIDHKFGCAIAVSGFRPFPYRMIAVKNDPMGEPIIIAVSQDQTCVRMSIDFFAGVVKRELTELSTRKGFATYWSDPIRAKRLAENWLASRPTGDTMPKSVAFSDDPEPSFHRIKFKKPGKSPDLEQAPTWASFGVRMGENWEPFCAWVWSILEQDSDRKQAVYIFGPTDCGKSRISEALSRLVGKDCPGKGAFCVMNSEYLESRWGVAGLLGKRLCVIDEAKHGFLAGNTFKTITGSRELVAEEKGKKETHITIDAKFLLTSNESPNIPSRQELKERLIVCKLKNHGLRRDQLIPESKLDEILEREMPAFLAFCRQCYEPFEGGIRIECGYTELDNAIHEHEQKYQDAWEDLYVSDQDSWIASEDIRKRLQGYHGHNSPLSDQEFKRFMESWKNKKKIRHSSNTRNGKSKSGYWGLRESDYQIKV